MAEFKFTEEQETWLKALESGKYEQLVGALHDGTAYCCLGIACELSNLDDWIKEEPDDDYMSYLTDEAGLPDAVQKLYRLRSFLGDPLDKQHFQCLSSLNDQGKDFKKIAAHLRAHPEQYFTNNEDPECPNPKKQ